jgi:hypothetical protein
MTAERKPGRWRTPAGLAVVVGAVGFLMVGIVGLVAGIPAGAVAARRTRPVFLASAAALVVTMALTILERPLSEANIAGFASQHDLAEIAGAVAAVLLLGALVGVLAHCRHRLPGNRALTSQAGQGERPVPTATIAPVLVAALVGALALWGVGDRMEGLAIAVLIAVLVLAGVVGLIHFRSSVSTDSS